MDCAVIPLSRYKNLSLVQTVDFFYPLVDNPSIMGKIALANVLSDVYAVGVTSIDKLSLILSSPTEFTSDQRDIILPMIIDGFNKLAKEAGCEVGVRNIAVNEWCIIGGIATSVCKNDEIIMPSNAKIGDAIVLTKPLGTQLASNAQIWWTEKGEKYEKLAQSMTEMDIFEAFQIACQSMTHLNKNGAQLMHKYNAHAGTDVTGFGLLGHALNLAEYQTECVEFIIDKLPIIKNVLKIGQIVGQEKKLKSGRAVETSGGLLICMPAENAEAFCDEYANIHGNKQKAWIVGRVEAAAVAGRRSASLAEHVELFEVQL